MVDAGFTPMHPNAFEPLLYQPLTDTFNHPRAQRNLLAFKGLIAHMGMMALKVSLYLNQSFERFARQQIGINQRSEHG